MTDFKIVNPGFIPDVVTDTFALRHRLSKEHKVLCKYPLWFFRKGLYLEFSKGLYLDPLKVSRGR